MACSHKEKELFSQITIIGNKPRKDDDDDVQSDSKSITSSDVDEEIVRDQWNSKSEFLFSCISYSIGLGNLWRFPFKCYENGGGAFLVPYLLFLFMAGMPLYFLELSMGQFASQGPFGVWHIAPIFIGLGYAMTAISFFCSVYYNVIVAWIIHYLYTSVKSLIFSEKLPWISEGCSDLEKQSNLTEEKRLWCANSSTRYWNEEVLGKTDSLDDLGGFQRDVLIYFCVAWVAVAVFLVKGVKGSGKVTYFTALFPYLVIAVLLVRGLTLEGASNGLYFYLVPQFDRLLDPQVWNVAASQIFYSLGLAFGSLITLASYSPFKNNVLRMTLIVTVVNCSTSIIAGIVIFCVIGHLAHGTNQPVEKVVASGPGLTFVVYPDAVSQMPGSAFWAALFFFMLLNLGFGSQLALVETVITAVTDRLPKLLKYKWLVCLAVCVGEFLLGLPMVTRGGVHWLNIMDTYSCSYSLFVISFIEVAALVYIYGPRKILDQVEAMLGHRALGYWWWYATWAVTAPVSMFLIFILNMWFYSPMEIDGQPIPRWAEAIGWSMALFSVIFIPCCAAMELYSAKGSFVDRVKTLLQPDNLYRPHSTTDLKAVNELFLRDSLPPLGAASNGHHRQAGSGTGGAGVGAAGDEEEKVENVRVELGTDAGESPETMA